MTDFEVLIVGGGIAGSVAAYWLGKAGAQVTVIEAVSELRKSGQGIDVRGKGVQVVRRMGVEEQIRSRTTKEAGISFVDGRDRSWCKFDVSEDPSGKNAGFTSEIEIMRKDLAEILYEAADAFPNVTFKFGYKISSMSENATGVSVTLNEDNAQDFHIVIGADGLGSQTRKLMLGPADSKATLHSLDMFTCYFSMDRTEQDGNRARWYNAPGRRSALIRPKNDQEASGYLSVMQETPALRSVYDSNDQTKQKQLLTDLFSDAGWECPRLITEMQKSKDFYFQYVAQVRLPPSSWHKSRVVLIGDAASCPSPLTGLGTTVAILGAYVLAGELSRQMKATSKENPVVDHQAAFEAYADTFGPYVKEAQYIPLNGKLPKLINPETWWGISIMRYILWGVQISGVAKLVERMVAQPPADKFPLKEYEF